MAHPLYLLAAVVIGACLSLQPPINSAMARTLGSPLLAATCSIAISLAAVVLVWLLGARGAGSVASIARLPGWVALGGLIGVVFVVGGVVVAPALGVASFFVCVVFGQLVAATWADHVGAFGAAVQPVSVHKALGLLLVLAGSVLVQRGR